MNDNFRLRSAVVGLAVLLAPALHADPQLIDRLLGQGRATYNNLKTYSALLDRTELLGRKVRRQTGIILRFRKPKTIYIRFTTGPDAGTEALWDPERLGNQMAVRRKVGGVFVPMRMDPMTPVRTGQERHPIHESDLGHLLGLLESHVKLHRSTGQGSITYEGEQTFDGRKTHRFSATFPQDQRFYAGRVIVDLDQATGLPLRVESYGWDGDLWEIYEYRQFRLNPDLSDSDFSLGGS